MKKIFVSALLALTLVGLPLAATAQTTTIPGGGNGSNINQLMQLVALLERLLDLQQQLANLQGGDGVATIGGSAGSEATSTSTEPYYLSAVSACTAARIGNATEMFTAKNNFADFTIVTLNNPRLSLQSKGQMISDRQGPVSVETKNIDAKKPGIEANCNKTISPLADVASTTPAVQSAIARIDAEVAVLESQRTVAAAVPSCTAAPLSSTNFDLAGLKKAAVAEKCKVNIEYLSAQITAKNKAKVSLERI